MTINVEESVFVYDYLSSMISDALIVLNFPERKIQYISSNSSILSNYSLKQNKDIEFDYFIENIHPEDIEFCEMIYNIIEGYLINTRIEMGYVDYFSFTIRVKNCLSNSARPDYYMVYVKLRPQWNEHQLQYGFCMLSLSVIRKQTRQLQVYYKDKNQQQYSFDKKIWYSIDQITLTKRQKEVLMWAQLGFSLKETAEKMHVADKTVENMRWTIFDKFGVRTIEQAIQFANNRNLY